MSNKAEDNVVIRNIYYMMAYAYRSLDFIELRNLGTERFDYFADLLAAILITGINMQRKRGLERGYAEISEDLMGIRGRVIISSTFRNRASRKLEVSCSYDDYSVNTPKNQILKFCAKQLLGHSDVSSSRKVELKSCLLFFSSVDDISSSVIDWSTLRYDRNSGFYQLLMNVCWMIVNERIIQEAGSDTKLASFLSDRQLNALYEKFLLEYFRREHPELSASAKIIENGLGTDVPAFLPKLCTDITLERGSKTLIIDAKCYGRILKYNYGRELLSPENRNQIGMYVMHESYGRPNLEVSGMLLYAKTKSERNISEHWTDLGHTFYCNTLNLDADFVSISTQLDQIANLIA